MGFTYFYKCDLWSCWYNLFCVKGTGYCRFSWWMCCKNEIRTKVLYLKSSNVSKFYPNPLKLCTCRETTAAQKRAWDFHKSDALAQTNKIKYECFFLAQKTQKIIFSRSKTRNKIPEYVFLDFILFFNIAVEKFVKK